jgi:hypothetical protein
VIEYVAGVVDSRGHITLARSTPRIRVTTRRVDLLHGLARHSGVGVLLDDRGYDRRGCATHCTEKHQHNVRQSAYWNCDGARAVVILYNVLPFLICQTGVVYEALVHAAQFWPVNSRTEVTEEMRRLGWTIPDRADMPRPGTAGHSQRHENDRAYCQ